MKRFWNVIVIVIVLSVFTFLNLACDDNKSPEQKKVKSAEKSNVELYYFHYTRRCKTCITVEEVAQDAIEEFYKGKVKFFSINLDDKESELKAKELGISGQTLIIVSGDIKINITNEAFMNARKNPDKLEKIINEKIKPLI